jgi:YD repeat-containing protein
VLCIATLIGCLLPCGVIASALYTYDAVGRVTSALYDNGTCVAYLYDANGNRTSQNTTLSGTPVSPVWGSGVWGCFAWTATP